MRGHWPQRYVFWNHISAAEIRARVRPEEWGEYLKFSIIRNPWDQFVSWFFWRRYTNHTHMTIDEALKLWDPAANWNTYSIDGDVAVDVMLRFETLESDLSRLTERLAIPFDHWLPSAKSDTGRGGRSYHEILEPKHIELIRNVSAREIEIFGYQS